MKTLQARLALGCALGLALAAPCWAATTSPQAAATNVALTSPSSASAVVATLQNVCLPLIQGASMKQVAHSNGLRRVDGQWMLRVDRDQRIDLNPPDAVNPNVCGATVVDTVGAQPAIREAIDNWARARSPALTPVKIDATSQGPLYLRTTSTWQGTSPKGVLGVVFSAEKTPRGQPVRGHLDQSELLMSLTPNTT